MSPETGRFIDLMVRCDVLTFGDFVAKSGRHTPYFINAGRFSTGGQLAQLGAFYASAIHDTFGDGFDVLFGPAYKGIPLAVSTGIALADRHGREVGVCFDRKEAKDHGEGGVLIGHPLADGDRVIIVEDVTTAGTSIRETVPLLMDTADVEIVGIVVGVDRQEQGTTPGLSALAELGATLRTRTLALATIDDIVEHLRDTHADGRPVLSEQDLERIQRYRALHGAPSS